MIGDGFSVWSFSLSRLASSSITKSVPEPYDCRVKPDRTDKATTARIKYFTYTEYVQQWEEITSIFSREAILKGSFDTYAEATKGKRGTTEVDTAFLQEIE